VLVICQIKKSYSCTNSVLEVAGGTFQFGGKDFFDLSDDTDFVGSVLSVSGILSSPGLAFGFLLGLSSGGGVQLLGGIILSLSLDTQLLGD
jgi:hypothetical protein